MHVIDGKQVADKLFQEIKEETEKHVSAGGKKPHLGAVLVGEDGASITYVNHKVKDCKRVGFDSSLIRLPADVSEEGLLEKINELNHDKEVDGFIVQLPLPKHIDEQKIKQAVHPAKDVDGAHPVNVGRMAMNLPTYLPATPFGILKLIEHYGFETSGKHCVVVGRSQIVGSPMSILMGRNNYPGNCTVTLTHRYSENLEMHTRLADILIVAVGIPLFIKSRMVKKDAIVIDVGITRVEDASKKSGYRLLGDVDYDEIGDHASYMTPVPGGVGPMTRIGLLLNTLKAAKKEVYQ